MRQEDIDNWFQYHTPTPTRLIKYFDLRNSAKAFAELFDKSVPDCADKTAAMRHLRETVMAMNLAIACNPEAENRDHEALGTAKDAYSSKGTHGT
jgi:hypothetical protein